MATILHNESAWSTTVASNANVDTGVNWAEGQDAATVNDSGRGMMAARAKARLDQGGYLAAAGSANALTVNPTQQVLSQPHIAAGQYLVVRATADNTSATVTFAPDGLTAAPIKRSDGSALAIGSIKSGMMLQLYYNAGSSEWRCANIAPLTGTGGSIGFSAVKAGDQPIATIAATLVTFPTEVFDVGNYYAVATHAWTPPPGLVSISAAVQLTGFTVASGFTLYIYKNTAPFRAIGNGSDTRATINVIDQATGADSYQVYVDTVSDNSYQISSSNSVTWFVGAVL